MGNCTLFSRVEMMTFSTTRSPQDDATLLARLTVADVTRIINETQKIRTRAPTQEQYVISLPTTSPPVWNGILNQGPAIIGPEAARYFGLIPPLVFIFFFFFD